MIYKKANIANAENRKIIINELKQIKNIRIKIFIHSIAFGTLKKMISGNDYLNNKNIEMTSDVMCNSLVYWAQDLYNNQLLKKGSHILSMTSAGGRKNWDNYGAISIAKAGLESAMRQLAIELASSGISSKNEDFKLKIDDAPYLLLMFEYDKVNFLIALVNPT